MTRTRGARLSSPLDDARGLADIRTELAELQARVAALEGRQRRRDPVNDARLLSALAARFGGEVFSAAQVRTSSDPALRVELEGISARQIGAWLRRMQTIPVAPYRVQCVGRDGRGRLWELTAAQ